MNIVREYLKTKAIWVSNIPLLSTCDSIVFIELCQSENIKILGIDTFIIYSNGIQPLLEESVDYSINENSNENNWNMAKEFIFSRCNKGYYYEIVI